jgi:hypothetical protein
MIKNRKQKNWYIVLGALVIIGLLIVLYMWLDAISPSKKSGGPETFENRADTPDVPGENRCYYVSSRGILKSCNVHSVLPVSSSDSLEHAPLSRLRTGHTLYICSTAIPAFAKYMTTLPPDLRFTLVSGDADETIYEDVFPSADAFTRFIEDPRLTGWFAQNCMTSHPKIHPLPIGLDYHSSIDIAGGSTPQDQEAMILRIKNESVPFWERKRQAYSNYHFNMKTKYSDDRRDAYAMVPPDLVYYEPERAGREATYRHQSQYACVISPFGNGYDCHRTWEALILGCIPIVKTSALDVLYQDLPVWIVQEWSDVTEAALNATIERFRAHYDAFAWEKLTLAYWMNRIATV